MDDGRVCMPPKTRMEAGNWEIALHIGMRREDERPTGEMFVELRKARLAGGYLVSLLDYIY